jgi:acyl transferase domain-containing protein/acyl carrier protein
MTAATKREIAIVGMACRFPGPASDLSGYRRLLERGEVGIGPIPPERWDSDAYFDPSPRARGKSYSRHGGFQRAPLLGFDAAFFGISPNEAWPMDPAQRMLLELAWHALEDASIPPSSLVGSKTGVFVGLSTNEYAIEQARLGNLRDLSPYHGTGLASSFGAGRISHTLGLEGPCVAVDTACSSGLVATLQAIQALEAGDCDLALAGASNVLISPTSFIVLCRLGALSLSGRCRPFDADADGYVRAEGGGVLVLKPLRRALADGNRIHGVIMGGAYGHDGRGAGLTMPRMAAQERIMNLALADAQARPVDVTFLEAHGTGTPVGDPTEAESIQRVYGSGNDRAAPLYIGAVKGNIGHLEIASGIASVIKAALVVKHGSIPANPSFSQLSPHIGWNSEEIRVPTETVDWNPASGARIAAINSFGLSGTNAHLILREHTGSTNAQPSVMRPRKSSSVVQLLPISAHSNRGLRRMVAAYSGLLEDSAASLASVAHSAMAGRSHLTHRIAITARSKGEALQQMQDAMARPLPPASPAHPQIAFLCTGQGAQYSGMGKTLYRNSDAFRDVIDECDEILQGNLDVSLRSVMFEDEFADLLAQTQYTQPALLAFQLAMAALWAKRGVKPTHLIGHSVGEFTAAVLSGVFTRVDALRLVAERGRLMTEECRPGGMAAVSSDEQRVSEILVKHGGSVCIAAVNSANQVVISGSRPDLQEVVDTLHSNGVKTRQLSVQRAFHSGLMEPMLRDFHSAVELVSRAPSRIPIVSNVTGGILTDEDASSSDYWTRHVRAPVRFSDGVACLRQLGVQCWLEIGPHPTMLGMAALSMAGSKAVLIPSLRREHDEEEVLQKAAAQLYVAGAPLTVGSDGAERDLALAQAELPLYAFEGTIHDPRDHAPGRSDEQGDRGASHRPADEPSHPLLFQRLQSPALSEIVYQTPFSRDESRSISGYRVRGTPTIPAGALLEMTRAGLEHSLGSKACQLEDVKFNLPLRVSRGLGRVSQLVINTVDGRTGSTSIASCSRDGRGAPIWSAHVTASFSTLGLTPPEHELDLDSALSSCRQETDAQSFYEALRGSGTRTLGLAQTVDELHMGDGELVARLSVREELAGEVDQYAVHPTLLEAALQLPCTLVPGWDEDPKRLRVQSIQRVRVTGRAGALTWIHVVPSSPLTDSDHADASPSFDVLGYSDQRTLLLTLDRVELAEPDPTLDVPVVGSDELVYELEWRGARALPIDTVHGQSVVLMDDGSPLADRIAQTLRDGGASVSRGKLPDITSISEDATDLPAVSRSLDDALEDAHAGGGGRVSVLAVFGQGSCNLDQELAGERILESNMAVGTGLATLVRACATHSQVVDQLLVFSQHAVSTGTSDLGVQPGRSALWGTVPVARSEHPELNIRLIDLDSPRSDAALAACVYAELIGDREDRVAYRDGNRSIPRLIRSQGSERGGVDCIRPRQSYLVTGATGGLGRSLTAWLVEQKAGMVWLNSRRAPEPSHLKWMEELSRTGSRVEWLAGDVADPETVQLMAKRIRESEYPLDGVFHAAGALDDRLVKDLTALSFQAVMSGKVAGAWNLHEATRPDPLRHFVLFSSISSFMAPPLQGNYAAANACLATLSTIRKQKGLPALAVDWGPWSGGGMASRLAEGPKTVMQSRGFQFLPPQLALDALGSLMQEASSRATVMGIDWDRFSRSTRPDEVPALLGDLVDYAPSEDGESDNSAEEKLEAMRQLPASERASALEVIIIEFMADALGVAAASLGPDQDARESGLDSLMLLELRHRVEAELGLLIPVSALMEELSAARIAQTLSRSLESFEVKQADSSDTSIEGEI